LLEKKATLNQSGSGNKSPFANELSNCYPPLPSEIGKYYNIRGSMSTATLNHNENEGQGIIVDK
jgi:hypothetical protein